jgi:hypothetical protein
MTASPEGSARLRAMQDDAVSSDEPHVVGTRSPDRGERDGRGRGRGRPRLAIPVENRALVANGPDIVRCAPPHADQTLSPGFPSARPDERSAAGHFSRR